MGLAVRDSGGDMVASNPISRVAASIDWLNLVIATFADYIATESHAGFIVDDT